MPEVTGRYLDVSCSQCGEDFHIPQGADSGFSHCDNHTHLTPMTEADRLGLTHAFQPNPEYPRFCAVRLDDGPCGWGDWLHDTTTTDKEKVE